MNVFIRWCPNEQSSGSINVVFLPTCVTWYSVLRVFVSLAASCSIVWVSGRQEVWSNWSHTSFGVETEHTCSTPKVLTSNSRDRLEPRLKNEMIKKCLRKQISRIFFFFFYEITKSSYNEDLFFKASIFTIYIDTLEPNAWKLFKSKNVLQKSQNKLRNSTLQLWKFIKISLFCIFAQQCDCLDFNSEILLIVPTYPI